MTTLPSRIALVAGPPFPGCQALPRALARHPEAAAVYDAHVLTPLAYLGYYRKVYKAPYDHILAAEAQRLFVEMLPNKEADYIDACRAYCDRLYEAVPVEPGVQLLIDATPEYATVLPIVRRILPDARYVVITRHPLALLAAGMAPVEAAGYVRDVAAFLRQDGVARLRVRFEDFVDDPEGTLEAVCLHLNLELLPEMLAAARQDVEASKPLDAWAATMTTSPEKLVEARDAVRRVARDDMQRYGYSPEHLLSPIEAALGRKLGEWTSESFGRRARATAMAKARVVVQHSARLNKLVRKARLAFEVLLRE